MLQGPCLCSMIMASVFRLGAKYPIDASFLLFLLGNASALLYISTLLLEVQFRGDFGAVSDTALLRDKKSTRHQRRANSNSNGPLLQGLLELLRVPMDDFAYMMAPSSTLSSKSFLGILGNHASKVGDAKGI